jgi:hypothetical protein
MWRRETSKKGKEKRCVSGPEIRVLRYAVACGISQEKESKLSRGP